MKRRFSNWHAEEFYQRRLNDTGWDRGNLCDPPTPDMVAMNELISQLLGPVWYVAMPENHEQVNTAAIYEIIRKYVDNKPQPMLVLILGILMGFLAGILLGG